MDTTSRLLMLLDVVEQGSFAKAAENRNVDRSVISKQINRLEDELGVRLLNRTTRSFSLTAAGAEMIKKGGELRLLLNDTVRLAENFHQEPRGVLKISSSSIIAKQCLQPVINDFQKRFEQVEVELNVNDRMVDIVADGYDLAFRVGDPKDSTLIARKLARNRLCILASPDFIATYGMPQTIDELAALPAASYASNAIRATSIKYVNNQGEPVERVIKSVFRANDGEILLLKALSGTAFVVAPAFLLHDEVIEGQLLPIMTDIKLLEFSALYAIYPHRDLPVRTRLFLDAVREYIGTDVPVWERKIPNFDKMYQG
ncbi:LysR family transcriptional regulator [Colwellia sp. MSW7]|uniref:LysR family transcriptional regulator n=1 Tax=Colwellia maritima TaxID=2912588 RepID=A0ABS9X7R5_9GAMM|nr:LysR family transcriptional regulator [Colwellia maritima]MCI2285822.1 LysR family transcriptional regulator [Colwellia maritima]